MVEFVQLPIYMARIVRDVHAQVKVLAFNFVDEGISREIIINFMAS